MTEALLHQLIDRYSSELKEHLGVIRSLNAGVAVQGFDFEDESYLEGIAEQLRATLSDLRDILSKTGGR